MSTQGLFYNPLRNRDKSNKKTKEKNMSICKEELVKILEPVGQTHILRFWDELSDTEKENLGTQIKSLNWPEILKWVESVSESTGLEIPFDQLKAAPYVALNPETEDDANGLELCRQEGINLLKSGRVAGFTVAGGQGTRLGYDGPKGTYKFTEIHNKSLFQFFAESLARHQEKYGVVLPWYIMTSPANNQATVDFFKENDYFGLDPKNIMFFMQGTLPAFTFDGKALLETKSSLALSANGHGGSFVALRDSGALEDMKKRGIDILTYWQVDNPLVNMFDPLFIGMHHISGSEMSSRALIKRDAKEKLGHFCLLDGRTIIIEYSDMPDDLLYQTDDDGRLSYRAGSPAMHILSRDFLERLTNGTLNLQPHRANKKIVHVDESGNTVKPESPNAIKLEFFLFDALPLASNPLILEGNRDDQFAPIKNAEGSDSPDTCRAALRDRSKRWLAEYGITLPAGAKIEISPRRAVEAKDLEDCKDLLPKTIADGDVISID